MNTEFKDLEGKTVREIVGGKVYDEEMIFKCTDGTAYRLFHSQDCCETVKIEDISGDLEDLIGSRILKAEEVSGKNMTGGDYESATWTFYLLRTNKGSVTIRWLGESNGYYSERVNFVKVEN